MEAFQLLFQESLCSSVVECPTSDTKVTGLNPVLGEYFFQGFCQKSFICLAPLYLFLESFRLQLLRFKQKENRILFWLESNLIKI